MTARLSRGTDDERLCPTTTTTTAQWPNLIELIHYPGDPAHIQVPYAYGKEVTRVPSSFFVAWTLYNISAIANAEAKNVRTHFLLTLPLH